MSQISDGFPGTKQEYIAYLRRVGEPCGYLKNEHEIIMNIENNFNTSLKQDQLLGWGGGDYLKKEVDNLKKLPVNIDGELDKFEKLVEGNKPSNFIFKFAKYKKYKLWYNIKFMVTLHYLQILKKDYTTILLYLVSATIGFIIRMLLWN